jgi:tRNA A-37 threonylcarbamoyl transferase component Bud32
LDGDDRLRPGTRLGRYEVVAPLGRGGGGEVYRARDSRLAREVALKVLPRAAAADRVRRRRFEREARLAGAVSHPHLLAVYDAGVDAGRPYVVFELLEGETLRERLRPGPLAPAAAVSLGAQIARGLAALHERGIVHRDLKPENLFVTADGRIKILDLGLSGVSADAARAPADLLVTEDAVGGTAAYMSPEQVRRERVDARSDIFSCGAVLYEMLAGRRPFLEATAAETMTAILRREPAPLAATPAVPRALCRVVERCLAKAPAERFAAAHDLAIALEAVLEPAPATLTSSPAGRARPHLWGALAAIALLATTASGPPWALRAFDALAGEDVELARYESASGRFQPFLGGIAADGLDFSRDGSAVVLTTVPAGELWVARVDGRMMRRLTQAPFRAGLPRFSPDGRTIAFAGRGPDEPWRIHLVPAKGGPAKALPAENVLDPGWTAGGKSLLFAGPAGSVDGIFEQDLHTGATAALPGSGGLFSPRPSPDGRLVAALRGSDLALVVFDRGTGSWTGPLATSVAYPAWSRDGAWLSFRREAEPAGIYRVGPEGGGAERIAALDGVALAGGEWGAWSGLGPDGAPLLLRLRADAQAEGLRVGASAVVVRNTTR